MLAKTRPDTHLSLFEKCGGLRVLRAVIIEFCDRVLDSDIVGHFFEDVDLGKLIDHQTKFFSAVLGGPAEFADQRLAVAHAHLIVTHTHFDEVIAILGAVLEDAGYAAEDLDTTLAAVEARRSLIVR